MGSLALSLYIYRSIFSEQRIYIYVAQKILSDFIINSLSSVESYYLIVVVFKKIVFVRLTSALCSFLSLLQNLILKVICLKSWTQKRKWCVYILNVLIILLHDNAQPHVARMTLQKLTDLGCENLPHPPYFLNLSPTDNNFFCRGGHLDTLFRKTHSILKEK